MTTRIEKSDLARDALYDKVNTMIDEVNTKIDNKAKEWADSVSNLANRNLSNLTSEGQNIANWSTNVTNCITEIPQDIKLELNNGTLTLKAGSTYYKCDGNFTKTTTSQDYSITNVSNGTRLVFFTGSSFDIPNIKDCNSGASEPTTGNKWFNISNKILYSRSSGNWQQRTNYSLPLAIITVSGGAITSIDQVFNGFGYIGSTIYVLPGVKGLIPNGRNIDGSLNNREFTVNNVMSKTYPQNVQTGWLALNATDLGVVNFTYNEVDNYVYNNNLRVPYINRAGYVVVETSGKITSFTPKTVFHALDYNEISRLESIINNKVNKSGDTMIGNLIINRNIPEYILQDSTLDLSETFTDNRNDVFFLERDKNGKDGCFITFRHDKYDANSAELCASNGIDSNRKIQSMGIWVKKNGEYGTYAPHCNFGNSIVTTISHGNNWIRFGNGLIIQWIYFENTGATTWTFPTPFSNTNYAILSNAAVWYNTANKKTTLIQITDTNFGVNYKFMSYYLLAIGY